MVSKYMISVSLIQPSLSNWDKWGEELFSIETKVFEEKSFTKEMMQTDISDPNTLLALLKDEDKIVGFAYTVAESENVAGLVDIAILQEYQGNKYVGVLMSALEEELKKEGYTHLVQYSMIHNGYADKVQKHYGSRIVESKDIVSEYGRQIYYKIKL